jgi:hypothetical protein
MSTIDIARYMEGHNTKTFRRHEDVPETGAGEHGNEPSDYVSAENMSIKYAER